MDRWECGIFLATRNFAPFVCERFFPFFSYVLWTGTVANV